MKFLSREKAAGFTLIEILIALAIGAIVLTVGAVNLASFRAQQNLESEARAITALLISARDKSASQESESRWGVFFENKVSQRDAYALFQVDENLFASSSYSQIPGTATDQRTVRSGIEFRSPQNGSSTSIVFSKVYGLPQSSTTIEIETSSGQDYKTIFISGNGRITYE